MDDNIREIAEQMRAELHRLVDRNIDEFILNLDDSVRLNGEEWTRPLSGSAAVFKGRKPLSVTFADGREVQTKTWKQVVQEILRDCCTDDVMRSRLQSICGKVWGKNRCILNTNSDGMDVPIKINDNIYFECKFDTESLLKALTERVLDAVEYDYSGIEKNIQKLENEVISPSISL